MSPADWRRETSKPFVDTLLALDPPHALGVLVAYAGHPAMNLANRLADCARNDLKRLADFLRVVSPSDVDAAQSKGGRSEERRARASRRGRSRACLAVGRLLSSALPG
jgi:hypothetical protein